ncbi:MAG: hypothetical protein IPL35_10420 [Sphingobacteriales bacterium]|nr:hypothetical protein [Sphingobacteriales bacterium]
MMEKDALFALIHSLNKSEKRFFKIFSSRHIIGEQNNYIALFDAIEQQKSYNEAALLKKFANKKFVKRLPIAKSYLYDMIVKAMSHYHSDRSIDNQLLELLRQISFLYEKNLLAQAQKLISKARQMALEYEKLSLLPEILQWQKKMLEARFYANSSVTELNRLYQESKVVFQQLANINEFWHLEARLYFQYNIEGIVRNRRDLSNIESVFNSPLMTGEDKALTFEAQLLMNKVYATYFFILRDFESCYTYIRKVVQLLEARPKLIAAYPQHYVQAINNLLNMTRALHRHAETQQYLQTLENLMQNDHYQRHERLSLKLFESYYYHRINDYLDRRAPLEGLPHVAQVEDGLKKWDKKIDIMGEVMLCYHIFKLYFEAEYYAEAAAWLQKILNKPDIGVRHDIFSFSYLLRLLLFYEMNKPDAHLQVCLQETHDYFSRRPVAYRFDAYVLQFLHALLYQQYPKENFYVYLQQLYNNLKELAQDPFEKKVFAYFDFLGWVERKIAAQAAHNEVLPPNTTAPAYDVSAASQIIS